MDENQLFKLFLANAKRQNRAFAAVQKLHKYLFWADKKIHSVFFIENKEDISEDLLGDPTVFVGTQ